MKYLNFTSLVALAITLSGLTSFADQQGCNVTTSVLPFSQFSFGGKTECRLPNPGEMAAPCDRNCGYAACAYKPVTVTSCSRRDAFSVNLLLSNGSNYKYGIANYSGAETMFFQCKETSLLAISTHYCNAGPHVTVSIPTKSPLAISASSLELAGIVASPSVLSSLVWTNTNLTSGNSTGSASFSLFDSTAYNWSSKVPLRPGTNVITIKATDINSGIDTATFVVITPTSTPSPSPTP